MLENEIRTHTCMLCDANCGLRVELSEGRVVGVRGNPDDTFSRGHICPKAAAIGDLMEDPDRVRTPLRRTAKGFVEVGWEEALNEIAQRVADLRRTRGADAVATYVGNPTVHDYGAALAILPLRAVLGGKNHFSALSVDTLPRMVASQTLYGVGSATPVPDIDRTDLLVVLGSNPMVSNGSGMVSPDIRNRLRAIQERGGRIVVLDPRRTQTAKAADEFHFVRPGTDALLMFAMIEHLFAQGHHLRSAAVKQFGGAGLDALQAAAARFPAESVEAQTGVAPETIRRLADELATTPKAIIYGRMGTCVQAHGVATTLLLDLFNLVAGNLDHEGGIRFGTPAADLLRIGALVPKSQGLGMARSRVDGLPGFLGEFPVAALLPEIETEGHGQIRALLLHAGNPVASNPNGARLAKALSTLDLVVAVDMYINDTTRHADFILPTTVGFERSHYPLLLAAQGVRDFASFHRPIVAAPAGVRESFDILLDLASRVAARSGAARRASAPALRLMRKLGPNRIVDALLRVGPHKLRLADVEAEPNTLDLGPLQARLREILRWKHKAVPLFPPMLAEQLPALEALRDSAHEPLVLISRRTLRSNNSWMHNMARLQRGKTRCTLEMNPADAATRGLEDGTTVRLASEVGDVQVPLAVTDAVMPGVVCLPHGFGQNREGVKLRVAAAQIGASVNDVIDHRRTDAISGTSALSGQPVTVTTA